MMFVYVVVCLWNLSFKLEQRSCSCKVPPDSVMACFIFGANSQEDVWKCSIASWMISISRQETLALNRITTINKPVKILSSNGHGTTIIDHPRKILWERSCVAHGQIQLASENGARLIVTISSCQLALKVVAPIFLKILFWECDSDNIGARPWRRYAAKQWHILLVRIY